MKTDQTTLQQPVFPQKVTRAISQLKSRLQSNYERAYPGLAEIIHLVLDEEEAHAWRLSAFPHLFLPDLVEAHIAKLNLRTPDPKHVDVVPNVFHDVDDQPAFALCG
jgi:hypothetical protein